MKLECYAESRKSYNDTSKFGTQLSCEPTTIRKKGTTLRQESLYELFRLYDSGKLAVTFFKGNKEVEEQLKDCFYKAVDKNIKNDQISKYVRVYDYGQYLDALKKELMSDEVCFKEDSNDALILEDFKKELFKKPIVTMQLIKMYSKNSLILQNYDVL